MELLMNLLRKGPVLAAICLFTLITIIAGADARAERKRTLVKLDTTMGEIVLELYPDKAPDTVANFLKYVKSGHYDGTIFHRVINGFMIQGGGMDAEMKEKQTGEPIKNEADNGLTNDNYTVAMARTQEPHSASAQFFINVADNGFLNHSAKTVQGWGYAVFGKVVKGMEVVDEIKAVPTTTRGFHQDVPKDPVTITKAEVIEE